VTCRILALSAVALCGCTHYGPQSTYVPIEAVEAEYGRLLTVGNHPTPDQFGNGERVGLFASREGTLWGLPIAVGIDGSLLACAPAALHDAPVTGKLPKGTEVVGAANLPTGWRGGTGDLEFILRNSHGHLSRSIAKSADLPRSSACWTPAQPGPRQRLQYYRLVR
jgi:hypothetical protein